MSRKSEKLRRIDRIMEEYRVKDHLFSEDDERVEACKRALERLPDTERALFILYAEVGNIRRLARLLKMSHSTLQYRISKIRKRLQEQVSEMTPRKDGELGS